MRQKGTRLVYDYWDGLRGERRAPNRSEVAPAALARSLAHVFILDAGAFPARFRIAGTWIGSLFGREWTNEPFATMFDRDDRGLVDRLVRTVIDEATVVVADLHAIAEQGRTADLELVLLPLADNPARLIGAIHAHSDAFWFGAYPLGPASLRSVRLLDPGRPLFGLPGRPAVVLPESRPAARRILRVIDGDAGADRSSRGSTLRPSLRLVRAAPEPANRGKL